MDIVAKQVYNELKDVLPEFVTEKMIIAGGCGRDYLLNKDFKDIDIFFPDTSKRIFWDVFFENSTERRGNFTYYDECWKSKKLYSQSDNRYTGHVDILYRNHVKVQVISTNIEADSKEDFASKLFDKFDYNINKNFYDGSELLTTEEFISDKDNWTATLSYLPDMKYFGKALERFTSLKEKYPKIKFQCDLFELKQKKEIIEEEKPKQEGGWWLNWEAREYQHPDGRRVLERDVLNGVNLPADLAIHLQREFGEQVGNNWQFALQRNGWGAPPRNRNPNP